MLSRERALVTPDPLRPVVRLPIVGERHWLFRNRDNMDAGIKIAAILEIVRDNLCILRAGRLNRQN